VVVVPMPVAARLARHLGTVPSRRLLPLSRTAILGGTPTMAGTSANLLVDGGARELGPVSFGLVEIAPSGLPGILAAGARPGLAVPRLLARRRTVGANPAGLQMRARHADLFFPAGAPTALTRGAERAIHVRRGDASLRRDSAAVRRAAGDVEGIRSHDAQIAGLREGALRGACGGGARAAARGAAGRMRRHARREGGRPQSAGAALAAAPARRRCTEGRGGGRAAGGDPARGGRNDADRRRGRGHRPARRRPAADPARALCRALRRARGPAREGAGRGRDPVRRGADDRHRLHRGEEGPAAMDGRLPLLAARDRRRARRGLLGPARQAAASRRAGASTS
jgi:hypothetical protein